MHSQEAASMYLARYRKLICIVDRKLICAAKPTKLCLLLQEGGIPHAAVRPVQCKRSNTLFPLPSHMHPAEDLPTPASPEETSMEKSLDLPQCTVPLAHTDTAEDSLLVGLALSQVFAHNVSTQAEAHNNQLGLRVGLLDVINHGTKFPGAT